MDISRYNSHCGHHGIARPVAGETRWKSFRAAFSEASARFFSMNRPSISEVSDLRPVPKTGADRAADLAAPIVYGALGGTVGMAVSLPVSVVSLGPENGLVMSLTCIFAGVATAAAYGFTHTEYNRRREIVSALNAQARKLG